MAAGSFRTTVSFNATGICSPAAVSRNVAMLERNLGQRLFHRNTRRLTLTEAGELLLSTIKAPLGDVQAAIASVSTQGGEPSGVLKVSVALTFGLDHVLPLLPQFLERYPNIRPDWHFENRPVDLIGEGFDAAIGGGADIPSASFQWRDETLA